MTRRPPAEAHALRAEQTPKPRSKGPPHTPPTRGSAFDANFENHHAFPLPRRNLSRDDDSGTGAARARPYGVGGGGGQGQEMMGAAWAAVAVTERRGKGNVGPREMWGARNISARHIPSPPAALIPPPIRSTLPRASEAVHPLALSVAGGRLKPSRSVTSSPAAKPERRVQQPHALLRDPLHCLQPSACCRARARKGARAKNGAPLARAPPRRDPRPLGRAQHHRDARGGGLLLLLRGGLCRRPSWGGHHGVRRCRHRLRRQGVSTRCSDGTTPPIPSLDSVPPPPTPSPPPLPLLPVPRAATTRPSSSLPPSSPPSAAVSAS
jgi:hypothetical protein